MNPRDFVLFLESPAGAELLGEFTPRRYGRGQMVSTPAGESNRVFIVRSGRVRIYLADEQRELTLAFLEPGDLFTTLSTTRPRDACSCAFIKRQDAKFCAFFPYYGTSTFLVGNPKVYFQAAL